MKARRYRSPHPGVKVKKRRWSSGALTYLAVFKDPDDGRERSVSLTSLGLTTAETRKAWAIDKSREILKRRDELSRGAPKRSFTPIGVAINAYLDDRSKELRSRTLEAYRESIERFREWSALCGLRAVELTTPQMLAQLRPFLLAIPRSGAAKGGKRGQRSRATDARSPSTINRDLRGIKSLLNNWRRLGLMPHVHSDDIADNLRLMRVPANLKTFLDRQGLDQLVRACMAHDAETFTETRMEHAGLAPRGCTLRHYQITPFVLTAVLTGCRLSEVLQLEWKQILLEQSYIALDNASGIKTARGRQVSLDETPILARLLGRLREREAGKRFVFGGDEPASREVVERCRDRLIRSFSAPKFDWQMLRRTCGTFLTCAPGIYGGSSAWQSAARLGHSVEVAQRHYIGRLRNIPPEARTLEAAMGLVPLMRNYLHTRHELYALFDPQTGEVGQFR